MGKKHDMYINYDRSYKKRGRRNSSKVWKVFFAMIVISGFGLGAYFAFGSQLNIVNKNGHSGQNLSQNEGTASNNNQSDTNGKSAKPTITVTPTASPIVSPVTVQNSTGAGSDADQTQPDTRVPVEVKGLYVTGYTAGTSKINDLINIADSTEINALVIDVKNDDGRISYAMDSTTAKQIGAVTNGIADMPALIKQLKEKNIYTIARIVSFKDPLLAEKRQDLALKFSDGSLYRDSKGQCWVNPYKKEVWDYLMEVATQAAAIGFNEIQFDYIRFSTGGDIDKVDFGEEAKTKSKEDVITDFTKYAYNTLKPLGVFVSADVYGAIINSKIDAGLVGQNYVEMSKYLDFICPMIYPSHFGDGNYGVQYPDLEPQKIITKALEASKKKQDQIPEGEHRAIVRPWLQDFTATWLKNHKTYGGPEVREQINGVYAAGYKEWLLWNASTNYSKSGLNAE